MKIHKPALLLILWIFTGFASALAQMQKLPPTVPESTATAEPVRRPVLAQPAPTPAATPNYIELINDKIKLEKGDRLSYRIIEERTPPLLLTINDSGDIDIPLIGHLRASGKTCKELSMEIRPLLEKEFYYKATVIVGLETHSERSIGKVYVMGQVRVPGGLEIPAGETLTVSKSVARSQGFTDFADKEKVRLIRKNQQGKNEMFIVDVGEIIDKGLIDKDPEILPNDTVIVPEVKRFQSKVYVLGRVHVPGGLELQQNEQLTVSKSIARVQGFAEYADREKVKLLRKSVVIPWFAVEDLLDPFSLSNKIIASPDPVSQYLKNVFTPRSIEILSNPESTKQQQKFVLIEELNKIMQGVLLYEEKRYEGIRLSADSLRLKAQNPKAEDLIRLNRMLLEDFYVKELRRNRPPEYQVFIVNVAEILDRGLVDKDPLMEPNDLVIVPESKRTFSKVSVLGQVHYPQTIEMLSGGNLTVSQVIARAGGFTEFAKKNKVKLLRKSGTDSYFFKPEEITNLHRLVKKLREHREPLTRFLWEHFTYPARQILTSSNATPNEQRLAIIKELNRLMKNGSIYTENRFVEVKLPPDILLAVTAQSGTCLMIPDDFIDLSNLVIKLNAHSEPLYQFLWEQFPEESKKVFMSATSSSSRQQESTILEAVITGLNNVLRGGSIFTPQRFEHTELSPEVLSLMTKNPQGDELVRLNRMLLEDACPQEIKRNNFNPNGKAVTKLNRRLFEVAFPKELKRHEEYDTIMVDMNRIIDKAELDRDPLIEPDDLVVVPESWINF